MVTIGRQPRKSRAALRIERPARTVLVTTAAVAVLVAAGAFVLGRGTPPPQVPDRIAVEATPPLPGGPSIVVPPGVRLPR